MRHIFIAAPIAAVAIYLSSCQKHTLQPQLSPAIQQSSNPKRVIQQPATLPSPHGKVAPTGGGEDDDKPIIMHLVYNDAQTPLQNAAVTMVSNTDSLQLLTDSSGKCTFTLPSDGTWLVRIARPDYQELDTPIIVSSSYSVKTSVLHR